MTVAEIASRDFVLLHAGWSLDHARRVLGSVRPPWVVVARREDGGTLYYAFHRSEAVSLVLEGPGDDVETAFALDGREPCPTLSPLADPPGAECAVVIEGGRVTGVVAERPVSADREPTRGEGDPVDLGGTRGEGETGQPPEPWNLSATFPPRVEVGSVTSLLVELTRQAGPGSSLPVAVARGAVVDVVVQPKAGLVVVGRSEGSITVGDDPLPIQFKLEATTVGRAEVRVLFFVEGEPLGAVTLAPEVVPVGAAEAAQPPMARSAVMAPMVAAPPDLEILILETAGTARPTYTIRLTAADPGLGLHFKEFGPIELRTEPHRYFADLFSDIEQLPLVTADDRAKAARVLRMKGNHLFEELVPEPLRVVLWSIRDRLRRVRIDSEEPWIPWELVRLSGEAEGAIEEGPFLCELEVARWIPGVRMAGELTMSNLALVVPKGSGLAGAASEREYLLGLAGLDRSVTEIPAGFSEVADALARGVHDCWHFSGHGVVRHDEDPNRSVIKLDDDLPFTPENISGVVRNLGRSRPLVFLNGCEVGRGGMSLTDIGGWAAQFLEAGAAAFVGAIWSVHDNPAQDFARTFYTRLLAGDAIAAAVLAARKEIQRYGDATWLAYTVYAHPAAVVV